MKTKTKPKKKKPELKISRLGLEVSLMAATKMLPEAIGAERKAFAYGFYMGVTTSWRAMTMIQKKKK